MDATHCSWSSSSFRMGAVTLVTAMTALGCRDAERPEPGAPSAGGTHGSEARPASGGGNVGGSSYGVGAALGGNGTKSRSAAAQSNGGTSSSVHGSSINLGGVTSSSRSSSVDASGGKAATRVSTGQGGTSASSNSSGAMVGGATSVATSAGGTTEVIPKTQCRGFWDFEALVDGSVSDESGHGQDLSVNGATLVQGPRGNHLRVTGTNSSAVASSSVIDASASFSISAWVKLDQLGSFNTMVSQDGRNISAFYLQRRSSGRLAFTTFPEDSVDATGCVTEGAIQPRAGEWYHLVATRDATTREQRLYVDGMLSGSSKCAGGFTSTGSLVLGRGRWDGEADWTSGGVDELCLLDRVIAPAEAVDLYAQGRPSGNNYLFAYFAEQAQGRGDGLRLAQSHDALYWGAIGGGKVFLPPTVGGKSFRDPHVMRDPKGTYHVVWTTSCVPWAESGCVQDKGFGHAQSTDLVHFSEATYVSIDLNVEHVWAPETFYDRASDQYMVYWSSPIDNNPSSADPHSIYYILTKDFVTFSKPSVLYTRTGRNFIDATIIEQSGGLLMFLKDEADGQKNIRVVGSTTAYGAGAWGTDPSAPLSGNYGAEGPSALLGDGKMYLFFDKYSDGKYGALVSTGLTNLVAPGSWQDISSTVFFAGVRHGTPIEVPLEVYRAVALKAGE